MKRIIKFRAYTEISNEVLGMKYDVGHNFNDTVMQFTGLLDRHGKEIYEGDIVGFNKDDIAPMVVTWNDTTSGWFPFTLSSKDYKDNVEIITNIYENNDLLKSNL